MSESNGGCVQFFVCDQTGVKMLLTLLTARVLFILYTCYYIVTYTSCVLAQLPIYYSI